MLVSQPAVNPEYVDPSSVRALVEPARMRNVESECLLNLIELADLRLVLSDSLVVVGRDR